MKLSPARILSALQRVLSGPVAPPLDSSGRRHFDPIGARDQYAATGKPALFISAGVTRGSFAFHTPRGDKVHVNTSNRREVVANVNGTILRQQVGLFGLRSMAAHKALAKRTTDELKRQEAARAPVAPKLAPAADRAAIIGAHAPVRVSIAPPAGLSSLEVALYRTSPLAAEILSHRAKGIPFVHESGLSSEELLAGLQAQMLHDLSRQH
jgi:hypothetical protein